MQRKVPQDMDIREMPQAKVRQGAQPLAEFARQVPARDIAIASAYASGGYTMREIGDYFGLHYSRVSKIVRATSLANSEEKGKT